MKTQDKVVDWVTAQLESGKLQIGDRLPPERALADTLGVSRNSLREALRVLEAMGVLHSSAGSGASSGTIVTAAPEQALSMAMGLQMASRQFEPEHIFHARLVLETSAMRDSDPGTLDVEAARAILDRMEQPGLSIEGFLRLDAEFHVILSRAAENPLLSMLMSAVSLTISDHTLELSHSLPDWGQTSRRLQGEHREIVDALAAGGRERAADLLERHIRGYYRETGQAAAGSH